MDGNGQTVKIHDGHLPDRNTKQHRQITQKQQSNRSQDIKSKHNAHLQLLLDSADEADLVIDNMLTCDRYIPAFA
jgi:hypothetical protein